MSITTDPDEQVYKNLQKMNISSDDVNILLLGETGVGKSTFINAFANYLEYDKFNIAEQNKVQCLIPTNFTVTNEQLEEILVGIGKDDNENNSIVQSATLETRSYVFPISKEGISRIRLIDTPGIGDTRGINQDNENLENILSYISNMEYLHAICFLLKPNNSRLTVMFHYCIKQLLSRLEKSASKNIIFLFTNTRSTFYKPGDTVTALKSVLDGIKSKPPYAEICFTKDNVFCLDNESFRYLVATKNGIQLGNKQSFADSWKYSVDECWRMLKFITGRGTSATRITPHKVKDTISVNEARRVILQLSQPLADIAELINDNIRALERHNKTLQTDNLSIADLTKNLYVPVINLRCKELQQPVTVCAAVTCMEIYTVAGNKKYHYKQRCHNPCYLQNVPKEHIGSPELVNCWAMTNRKCRICNCDFTSHMHIYYESETYDDKIDDASVKAQIKNREAAVKETKTLIAKIQSRKFAFEKEKGTIIKTMAKFAHFLQRNAIAPYNDSYQGYIEYLIDREKSMGTDCDLDAIKYLNDLLTRYNEEKAILQQALATDSNSSSNVAIVFDSIEALYKLPHTGKQIQQMHMQQARNQTSEHKNTEVVLEEANQQARNKKLNQTKANTNQKHNQQKPGVHQNNQQMKAKNRRQQNNAGQHNNAGQRNNAGHRKNAGQHNNAGQRNMREAELMYDRAPQYNHPGNTRHPPQYNNIPPLFPHPPGPPLQFPAYGNMPNYSVPYPQQGNHPPPHFFGGPPFPNYQTNLGSANYPQQGNYPNQFGQGPPNRSFNFNAENIPTRTSTERSDPEFDKWYANILNEGSNNSKPQKKDISGNRRYNNLSHAQQSSEEDETSDDNSGDYNKPNESEDDEEFKEFMRKNNLEYLVKPNDSRQSNNTSGSRKKKINKRQNNSNKNRNQDDSDSEENKCDPKQGNKGFFGAFLTHFK